MDLYPTAFLHFTPRNVQLGKGPQVDEHIFRRANLYKIQAIFSLQPKCLPDDFVLTLQISSRKVFRKPLNIDQLCPTIWKIHRVKSLSPTKYSSPDPQYQTRWSFQWDKPSMNPKNIKVCVLLQQPKQL